MSSSMLTREIGFENFGYAYASCQKIFGPGGGAVMNVIRKDLIDQGCRPETPIVMDWKEQIEKFYIGTPEVTPTYVILLCLRHFKR